MVKKNGWGLVAFIVFLLIFIVCLIITYLGLRKVGLINGETSTQTETNYAEMENKVREASKRYVSDFYNNELGIDTLYIKISGLHRSGYIGKLKDNNGDSCSGYVAVYKSDDIHYDVYLKCNNYVTEGYNERKDG